MSNNKIPDCCVARIHERLIDILNLKEGFFDVAYLCCDDCGEGYRLTVGSCESLSPEVHCTRYHIVCEGMVEVEREDEVESRFKSFVIPAEPKYYRSLEFVHHYEEPEEVNKLQEQVDYFVKHL